MPYTDPTIRPTAELFTKVEVIARADPSGQKQKGQNDPRPLTPAPWPQIHHSAFMRLHLFQSVFISIPPRRIAPKRAQNGHNSTATSIIVSTQTEQAQPLATQTHAKPFDILSAHPPILGHSDKIHSRNKTHSQRGSALHSKRRPTGKFTEGN
jgi:hypothetical protein